MDFSKFGGMMWPMLQQAAKHGQPALEKIVTRVNSRVADVRMTGEAAGGLVRVTREQHAKPAPCLRARCPPLQ